jgi:translation initiation factor 4B
LQLAKRTAPAEDAAPASSGPSPFGAAKPVNTAAKEREIEEKLAKDKPQNTRNTREQRSRTTSERSDDSRENNRQIDEEPKSDRHAPPAKPDRAPPPAAKSNPFGNARPIDTTKREREMEEKMRKTDISEDKPRSNQQKSQNDDTKTNSNEKTGGDEPTKVRSPPPPKEIEEPPKVAVSNKYAFLPEDDEVGSGKDDSD